MKDLDQSEEGLIAKSPQMRQILADALHIAKSNANVFIQGESGTGKEVIAKYIHEHSLKCNGPFIRVNCAAIPDTLIESEFFGHEKGAFTGALQTRLGRFELADKGTLLLDEISEVPLSIQPKLLRIIQEQEFERLGAMKSRQVDVRVISTSNRNMRAFVESKQFREDLYFRLHVIPIYLPPLRERKEDIIPLAAHFLEQSCLHNHREPKTLSPKAQEKLLAYSWPGNVRELHNIIERAVVMAPTILIDPSDLFIETRSYDAPTPLIPLSEIEEKHILSVLKSCDFNKTRAAKILDISVRTLRNKLKDKNIDSLFAPTLF